MKTDKTRLMYCFNSLAFLTLATILLVGCEPPPVDTVQHGYRGTGMEGVYNPRSRKDLVAANQPPAVTPPLPASPAACTCRLRRHPPSSPRCTPSAPR